MPARISRSVRDWRNLAYEAIPRLVAQRGGAVLWQEVEGALAHQTGWLAEHAPDLGPAARIDPHILGATKDLLVRSGVLRVSSAKLQGREVKAYVDASAESRRRLTEVERLAARKRRLYRSFLGWTGDSRLCGTVAERHVAASLESVSGSAVWLDPSTGAGQAGTIDGHKFAGALDHAGHVALNATDPNQGFVAFVIEDKNVRATIYPYHIEVWDLLCKAGDLPERVPILIAPRIHWTTYQLFKAIGAIGLQTTQQWFAPDPAIHQPRFRTVVQGLSFPGAVQLSDPDQPSKAVARFFTTTLHTHNGDHPNQTLIEHSRDQWRRAAPICARAEYRALRTHNLANRTQLFRHVLDELHAEGFPVETLLPRHAIDDADQDDDEIDWHEVTDGDL